MACLSILTTSACSTVTRGTTEDFIVESEPTGANVELSIGEKCETPCSLELKRRNQFDVKVSKSGYKDFSTKVTSEVASGGAAGLAGNILAGGVIGAMVDAGTGAALSLTPNPIKVILEKTSSRKDSRLDPSSIKVEEPRQPREMNE